MRTKTIDGIQVLRAAAAVLVVIQHAKFSVPGSDGWIKWGGGGVDIFFIISGFVMAYTTQGIVSDSLQDRLTDAALFMRKRIARIVPLYWLVLLWTTRRDLPDLNLLKDFCFIPHWNEMFPGAVFPIVIQGWSLNCEMFFYVLFAGIMLFVSFRVLLMLTLLVLTLAVAHLFSSRNAVAAFYGNDIILEFGLGVLLQNLIEKFGMPNWNRVTFLAVLAIGFGLLALGSDHDHFLFQGIPALIIVWAGIGGFREFLRWRLLAILGNASYAIYLFHWASFGAVKPMVAWVGPSHADILMVVHILAAIIAGTVIHLLIEGRLTRLAQRLLKLRKQMPAMATA